MNGANKLECYITLGFKGYHFSVWDPFVSYEEN
jgi:hypothetical protein